MRHRNSHRKLGRTSSHRNSLFRNMATELLRQESVRTTVEKAKELRPIVEKLITLGKKEDLHSRRKAYSYLVDKDVVHKLFAVIGPRFKSREGGYLRIVKADVRHGDAANMAYIELVEKGSPGAPPPPSKELRASLKATKEESSDEVVKSARGETKSETQKPRKKAAAKKASAKSKA